MKHDEYNMLDHGWTLVDLPDEYLTDIGPVLKKVAHATGAEQYSILQVSRIAITSWIVANRIFSSTRTTES